VQVTFHRLAAKEYRSAIQWYAQRGEGLDQRLRLAVEHAVSRIQSQSDLLPRFGPVYRWVKVPRFPYILVFRLLSPEEFKVMAVAHTRRRPRYWRGRR